MQSLGGGALPLPFTCKIRASRIHQPDRLALPGPVERYGIPRNPRLRPGEQPVLAEIAAQRLFAPGASRRRDEGCEGGDRRVSRRVPDPRSAELPAGNRHAGRAPGGDGRFQRRAAGYRHRYR